MTGTRTTCLATIAMACCSSAAVAQIPYERKPINYLTVPVNDPMARLQKKIAAGKATLKSDGKLGYLKSLLKHLDVPISSQGLVYSKTSFQASRISPRTPRAVYFSDDVYVGYVQGSDVLEISAVDPNLGAVFYTLEEKAGKPLFRRRTHECLQCHATSRTEYVPGHLVRSVYPQSNGQPIYSAGTFTTTHSSPLKERWGGWYVTGTHGRQRHLGNITLRDADDARDPHVDKGANITRLKNRFDETAYASRHSDIVALMVMEHQVNMHNLIAKANFQTRIALHDNAVMNKFFKRGADFRSDSTKRRIASAAEKVVRHLLFVDEAKLTAPIAGTSGFQREFESRGSRDKQGRSLRQFDLKTRLFRYPCSYLIDSEAFNSLPGDVKSAIYRRLFEILTGKETGDTYAHLSKADRRAILEILRATKRDLPAYWKPAKRTSR